MPGISIKMLRLLILVTFASLMFGCASRGATFNIDVDSISAGNAHEVGSYILLPGNEGTLDNDLQFLEFSDYISRALETNGYYPASSFEEADIAIYLAYAIGDPKDHQGTYSLPVEGAYGVGITSLTQSYSYTTYARFILITAYDLHAYRETKEKKELWNTLVTSSGKSGDLRRVFPILVAAAKPYFGTNTGRKIRVKLRETDEAVIEIRGVALDSATDPPLTK